MEDFGSRIKIARKYRGLTISNTSKRAGVSAKAMWTYETNARVPRLDVAVRLANTFQMTLDELFLPKNMTK